MHRPRWRMGAMSKVGYTVAAAAPRLHDITPMLFQQCSALGNCGRTCFLAEGVTHNHTCLLAFPWRRQARSHRCPCGCVGVFVMYMCVVLRPRGCTQDVCGCGAWYLKPRDPWRCVCIVWRGQVYRPQRRTLRARKRLCSPARLWAAPSGGPRPVHHKLCIKMAPKSGFEVCFGWDRWDPAPTCVGSQRSNQNTSRIQYKNI